ncbi:methionine synthase [Nocardioides sp. CFH 31398]|uniref:methionine synthase n=1 Tax=Nocardioides sp. CFH 31398 TaxID=2919579 RepID=UPI001F06DBC9|nr:methionine synthase [Nocardioides sp. CFH 31398]MCH1867255.1 methionine synthase [Nocardioides sp. CFH 31398]
MTRSTGVGSWPGDDAAGDGADFAEALRVVLGELDLPHLPELPGRGAHAALTGRGLAVLAELGADLQPSGWRLTGGGPGTSGVDHRRARSLLAQDLDALEEQAQGLTGAVKVQVAGPWTLAATVERPRGDVLLADHGARRELAQGLAEGVGAHVADVLRRVPGATEVVVQLDEPALPAVLAGAVPTVSGIGRHRTIHPPEASALLEEVLGAVTAAGGTPWVHCCAPDAPLGLLRGAGAGGLAVDLGLLDATGHDALAAALEDGATAVLGVLPGTGAEPGTSQTAVVERVERWFEMTGLDLGAMSGQVALSPSCGLAGATYAAARQACTLLAGAARSL